MADVKITIRPNGPLLVNGAADLVDHDGNTVNLPEGKSVMALCRCGASTTKPFCDGTHGKVGFDGTLKA
jgi:3-phenylpropionate/trans-cinnamate dioxygenase ferredoxin subunit